MTKDEAQHSRMTFYEAVKYDGLVKSKNLLFYVIPAKVRRGGFSRE